MFSSIFGSKKKTQEDDNLPPIPGASSDTEYVMIGGQPPPSASLYPQFGQNGTVSYPPYNSQPQPYRPAPPVPEVHLHYLQGVPFTLSKELSSHSNKEAYAIQIGDLMAFATRKLHLDTVEYNFSVERSVLMEGS